MSRVWVWLLYAFLSGAALGLLRAFGASGVLLLVLIALATAGTWFVATSFGRQQEERPPPALPVPPINDPGSFEGRVNRMTVEETEVPTNPGTPWQGSRLATVYVIFISGLRYTLDPTPVRRGRYDWLQEGMWVRATFDRKTRVVYAIEPAAEPTG